jgi:PAS domain S-box-containing protein
MTDDERNILQRLDNIVKLILNGKRSIDVAIENGIDISTNKDLKSLVDNIAILTQKYLECCKFMLDLSYGKLNTEAPRNNTLAAPFKQLHSDLLHLSWQIQQVANGDYDQTVSFAGDISVSMNSMIEALREKKELADQIKENELLFRSIFQISPDGIVMCNLNDNVVYASNVAQEMLNLQKLEAQTVNFNDFIHQDDKQIFKNFMDSLLIDGKTAAFSELRMVDTVGNSFWCELNASLLLTFQSASKGYIVILRDISERKIAQAKLLQYMNELDEANKAKDKMFSIISHDLKSPFNAILGTSTILANESNKNEIDIVKIRKISLLLNESVIRTFELLTNLLDWARMHLNHIEVTPEQVDVREIIFENLRINKQAATNKKIKLYCNASDNHLITSDKGLINVILRNLIGNAIKYTPEDGSITVSQTCIDGQFQISVSDTGVGIRKETLEKMFQSTINSTPGTSNELGTGLGLNICKEFVQKLGGEIWAESTYGHGATFTFTLADLK